MRIMRILYRGAGAAITCLVFLMIGIGIHLLFARDPARRQFWVARYTGHWARRLCRWFNIHPRMTGEKALPLAALIVANHVGSPDILALASCFDTFFVSKNDVGAWPLVGWLARLGATIFVDRARRQQVGSSVREIQGRLAEGFCVAIFPEGGATAGVDVEHFKSPYFQAAVLSGRPVQPVAIHYRDSQRPSVACWADCTFAAHVLRLLGHPRLDVELHVLPPVTGGGRRLLAEVSRGMIRAAYLRLEGREEPRPPFAEE